jgi:hypothetical protein
MFLAVREVRMLAVAALQLVVTLSLVGLIWFVQIVHYPMLRDRGAVPFSSVHAEHSSRTGWIVAPLMITELVAAVSLLVYGDPPLAGLTRAGLVLVGVLWASTFLIQVPLHRVLARGWNADAHRRLVRTNWIRTAAWSGRGFLVLVMAWGVVGAGPVAEPAVAPTAIEGLPPGHPPVSEQEPRTMAPPPVVYRT